ncbi:hypothetical protein [Chitinophaga sp. LS1]|nr:hypothetical protein [Chitinophaga sp. LS1]WPV65943.1 hypothetical protein QQL36_29520 [Chitinophaga sp. LS1]WPV67028.1 hypothetical protein QQL36_35135 [Chitinophaga sp. LS1]WPV67097.1 hypothetical protein QQL36_35495 [Chitinophaga sp. LS1]
MRKNGSAAIDVVSTWQSGRSSPSRKRVLHMAKDRRIVKIYV